MSTIPALFIEYKTLCGIVLPGHSWPVVLETAFEDVCDKSRELFCSRLFHNEKNKLLGLLLNLQRKQGESRLRMWGKVLQRN